MKALESWSECMRVAIQTRVRAEFSSTLIDRLWCLFDTKVWKSQKVLFCSVPNASGITRTKFSQYLEFINRLCISIKSKTIRLRPNYTSRKKWNESIKKWDESDKSRRVNDNLSVSFLSDPFPNGFANVCVPAWKRIGWNSIPHPLFYLFIHSV